MKNMFFCLLALGLMSSASVLAAGNDELWEMTTKMDMMGMSMPGATQKTCMKKESGYQPGKSEQNKNCEMVDVKVSGNTTKWKMRCTGENAMEGSGEMTRTADTMNGTVKMTMKSGEMVQVISGKRVGTCNYETEGPQAQGNAQMKQFQANMDNSRAGMCKDALAHNTYSAFLTDDPENTAVVACTGKTSAKEKQACERMFSCAEMKPQMCNKLSSDMRNADGFVRIAGNEKALKLIKECKLQVCNSLPGDLGSDDGYLKITENKGARKLINECGPQFEKVTREFCGKQLKSKNYEHLSKHCPAESQEMAKKHCQDFGRDYTSDHDSEYAPICFKYSKNKIHYEQRSYTSDEGSKEVVADKKEMKPGASDNPAGAVLDGAKKLKGLFKF